MQFSSLLLPVMLSLQTLLTIEITATGFYFASHGAFNNSCRVAECRTCSIGEYRLGCSNASGGICTNCTRIPNATFTTHGWFNNSCGFMCNAGYSVANGSGRLCSKVYVQYVYMYVCMNVCMYVCMYVCSYVVISLGRCTLSYFWSTRAC